MDDKTILPNHRHFVSDVALGSNLKPHIVAADRVLAKQFWQNYWDPSHTIQIVINDTVAGPLTAVTPGPAPAEVAIGVITRDLHRAIEMQLPGNLLQIPFYCAIANPAQIAVLVLAHESFHCGQMDRQTKMNIQTDIADSPFAQAIHPRLPRQASELCVALSEAYADAAACSANAAVKRLADSCLEGQADLVALMAVRHAFPDDFPAIRTNLVAARRNAHAADPNEYDNADALNDTSAQMPASLPEVALSMWKWIAKEILLDPALQIAMAAKNKDIPELARACRDCSSGLGVLRINVDKLISKSTHLIGYGKAPS